MPNLRDYQQRAIQLLRARHADRPLLCLPTGAGKTSVAAEVIRSAVARGRRAIFLVHRRELVDQAVARLAQFGIRAGRILAGHRERRERPVQVASIPTLLRRDHWPADLVIVDECAHAVSASWSRVLQRYDGPGVTVIGLTATPIRLDGRGLGDLFGCIVEPVSTRELIDRGYLVEPAVYAPPVDLAGVRVRRGDYALPEIAERMTRLVGSLTKTWLKHARGQRTVVFACTVDHSNRIVDAFRDVGVRAEHVDYKMPHRRRARILRDLAAGRIDMVSQVMLLSEGWDLPELQCAVLARPTKSLALFRQMVGRVMRPPGPVVVLDHAGNHHEHGLVTEPIAWDLDPGRKTQPDDGPPPLTVCPACFAVYPPDAGDVCPACGAPRPTRDEVDPPGVENAGELVALDLRSRRVRATMQQKTAAYRELVQSASVRGYKLSWARIRYKEKFGVWPRFRMLERSEYRCSGHDWEEKTYGARRVVRCSRCYAERAAVGA